MPGDLRDSTYSDFSQFASDRQSMAPSIAPSLLRASIATTAAPPMPVLPAQQAARGRPAVVSVHLPSSQTATSSQSPPVPQVPNGLGNSNSSIVARNVVARPIEVKKASSGTRVPTLANLKAVSARSNSTTSSPLVELDASPNPRQRPNHESQAVTFIEDSPVSPMVKPKPSFASFNSGTSSAGSSMLPAGTGLPPDVTQEIEEHGPEHRRTATAGLASMIEEAMNRAARDISHKGGTGGSPPLNNDSGPFSDANEVKENL